MKKATKSRAKGKPDPVLQKTQGQSGGSCRVFTPAEARRFVEVAGPGLDAERAKQLIEDSEWDVNTIGRGVAKCDDIEIEAIAEREAAMLAEAGLDAVWLRRCRDAWHRSQLELAAA